jgi:hypothetical protein
MLNRSLEQKRGDRGCIFLLGLLVIAALALLAGTTDVMCNLV